MINFVELIEEALDVDRLAPIADRAKELRMEHKIAINNDDYERAVDIKDQILEEREKAATIFKEKPRTAKDAAIPKELNEADIDRFIKLYVFGNRNEKQSDGTYGKFDPIPRLAGLIHLHNDIIKRIETANEQIRQ